MEEKKRGWIEFSEEGKTIQEMTEEEREEMRKNDSIHWLLRHPDFIGSINYEFNKFIVGEEDTRMAIFICACGCFVKNLSATFNVLINGESSSGKSWITKNVLNIFSENVFSKATYRTRISPKALTYWHNAAVEPDWTWDGKVLYLEDISNEILNSDVFKVMVSEGSTSTIVGKSNKKGVEMPAAIDIEIKGKPITFITTAMGTPIEEIKGRFLMIDLDESAEQTERIMFRQTQLAVSGKKEHYQKMFKEAFSQLKRVEVVIPEWIHNIINYMPRKEVIRWRREFPRFLEIIKCSASLHQFQRDLDEDERVIANEIDYEIARKIIKKISSSSGVEGLTRREKMAFESLINYYKENKKGCTRAEIHAYNPKYSDRGWEKVLDRLSNKGLVLINLETNPETNRKANYYYPVELSNISLPPFYIVVEQTELMDQELTPTILNKGYSHVNSASISSISSTPEITGSHVNSYSISSISSPPTEQKKCPDCDQIYYIDDWNYEKGTCRLCNPIKTIKKH